MTKIEPLLRAAQILRSRPACAMPLRTLHARLRHELGAVAGSYAQIYQQLKNRPQSFVILDSPQLLRGADTWPAQVREEYAAALEGTGIGACVCVALTESGFDDAQPGTLAVANMTVSELWNVAGQDGVLRDYLARAAQQLEEINAALTDAETARPTTRPPDPP